MADGEVVARTGPELNQLAVGALVEVRPGEGEKHPGRQYRASGSWRGLLAWIVVGEYRGYASASTVVANRHPHGLTVLAVDESHARMMERSTTE